MVKINKIYTRTGDDGSTGLVGGTRIAKNAPRVSAYGDIDELNSWIGYACSLCASHGELAAIVGPLTTIQNELFDLGSELASPPGSDMSAMPLIGAERVTALENLIDQFSGNLPELRSFVLPGGHLTTSALHIARTVARRAERSVISLHADEPVRDIAIQYLNRLSDFLFSLARYSAHQLKIPEVLWIPATTRR